MDNRLVADRMQLVRNEGDVRAIQLVKGTGEDCQFDEAFLRGRVLLANHFVQSPACLDTNVLRWRRQFYHSVPWTLERAELCDAAERITVAS